MMAHVNAYYSHAVIMKKKTRTAKTTATNTKYNTMQRKLIASHGKLMAYFAHMHVCAHGRIHYFKKDRCSNSYYYYILTETAVNANV